MLITITRTTCFKRDSYPASMKKSKYWVLIPAAGIGRRMGTSLPKQYLRLGRKTVIQHSIDTFFAHRQISGVLVGIVEDHKRAVWLMKMHEKMLAPFVGGSTRADTVRRGLTCLLYSRAVESDWVLVHDANRPFVEFSDIDALIGEVGDNPNGGLLCTPMHDTVKQARDGLIEKTLNRGAIFRAQTPQMFKIKSLLASLEHCMESEIEVTDESQAMEVCGYQPVCVTGSPKNIKITTPDDLAVAKAVLQQLKRQESSNR